MTPPDSTEQVVSGSVADEHQGVTPVDVVNSPLLHPVLAGRRSPMYFDPAHVVSDIDVQALLEAARWAPSAGNSQPWAFVVGRRGDPTHRTLVRHLAPSSAAWAPDASLLVVNVAHRLVEDTDWEFSEFSLYDLGQAVAHMTVQAGAMGLFCHQFRAFDKARITAEFMIPPHWDVATMTAIGRVDASAEAVPDKEPVIVNTSRRDRRPVSDIVWRPSART